jgi:hypothetical protein
MPTKSFIFKDEELVVSQSHHEIDQVSVQAVKSESSLSSDGIDVCRNRTTKRFSSTGIITAVLTSLGATGLIVFIFIFISKPSSPEHVHNTQENPAVFPSLNLKAATNVSFSKSGAGTSANYAKVFHVETGRGKLIYTYSFTFTS